LLKLLRRYDLAFVDLLGLAIPGAFMAVQTGNLVPSFLQVWRRVYARQSE